MAETAHILWTSGWDSTFQMLRLLVVEQVQVQPYYILDEDRPSTGMEVLTMKKIKERIKLDFPEAAKLLMPVKFLALSDIPANDDITRLYQKLLDQAYFGSQYDWLARFCHHYGVRDLQLCIHVDDKAHDLIKDAVEEFDPQRHAYRVSGKFAGTDVYELFKYYVFPVLKLTKHDMTRLADELNFGAIMRLTWFCHRPKAGKPCGVCNPCHYTIEEGLGWRIPRSRQAYGYFVRELYRPALTQVKWRAKSLKRRIGL